MPRRAASSPKASPRAGTRRSTRLSSSNSTTQPLGGNESTSSRQQGPGDGASGSSGGGKSVGVKKRAGGNVGDDADGGGGNPAKKAKKLDSASTPGEDDGTAETVASSNNEGTAGAEAAASEGEGDGGDAEQDVEEDGGGGGGGGGGADASADAGANADAGAGSAGGTAQARREAWAKVARARGAHFARPDRGKPSRAPGAYGRISRRDRDEAATGSAGDGAGQQGHEESWPGPFAEARRLMKNRDAAAARREAIRVNGQATGDSDGSVDSDDDSKPPPPIKVEWNPRGRGTRSEKLKTVPSLFSMCLGLLAEHFDHVESLGDVSAQVRNHLAHVLCRQLKLTTETLQRLSEPGVTELILPDCSRIEPSQMYASLLQCRGTLKVLRLDYCGRCLGDDGVMKLAKEGGFPQLETASLTGTFQLTNAGVVKLLECCPKLTGLDLKANSRLDGAAVKAVADDRRPEGGRFKSLSLAECKQLNADELSPLNNMASLESLSLQGLTQLTDEALAQALSACGKTLRHLDLYDCEKLTDASLRVIGEKCDVLESLKVGMCSLLSGGAMQQLFQYSGSAADVASYVGHEEAKKVNGPGSAPGQNAVPGAAYTPSNDDCIQQNGTRGKGKGKAKGKSKAAEPLPTEDVEEFEDGDEMVETQETEEMSVDAAEVEEGRLNGDSKSSGGEVDHDHESSAGSAAGVKRPAKKDGHAMLKSRLTNVSLRGLVAMDDGAVMAMAAACSDSLQVLDLKGAALVTDNSMVALARYCSSSLESLDLSFCRAVTNDGLGHLVDACPRLRSLSLWGCTQITDRFFKGHSREALVITRGRTS